MNTRTSIYFILVASLIACTAGAASSAPMERLSCSGSMYLLSLTGKYNMSAKDITLDNITYTHTPELGEGLYVAYPVFNFGKYELSARVVVWPDHFDKTKKALSLEYSAVELTGNQKRVVALEGPTESDLQVDPTGGNICRALYKADACIGNMSQDVDVATVIANQPAKISPLDALKKGLIPDLTPSSFSVDCELHSDGAPAPTK